MKVTTPKAPVARIDLPSKSRLATSLGLVRQVVALLAILLLCWLIARSLPPRHHAPAPATAVLAIISVALIIFARRLRQRLLAMGADEAALPTMLPDFAGAVYLTMLVLAGSQVAIPLAVLTPFIARAPEVLRRPLHETISCLNQGVISSVTLLAAGITYRLVSQAVPHVPTTLRANIIASVAASGVVLLSAMINRIWRQAQLQRALRSRAPESEMEGMWRQDVALATQAYLSGPALLFQTLLLCCVPLLPVTETLAPEEIGLAWTLLLAPMAAVYYLALTSVRLSQQTAQLRSTVGALNEARLRESQLKTYAALITRAQEDERRRLARELHDDTAQALVALARGLDALGHQHINPVNSPEDVRFIDQLVDLTQRTLESVRRACQDLRPSVLDDLGLSAALESLAGAMEARGLKCEYVGRGIERAYPPEVSVAVYRIAQEALSNALRHGAATRAQIELAYRSSGLALTVSDDGRGFDASGTLDQGRTGAARAAARVARAARSGERGGSGLGLMGMRERALLIGATLAIQSAPGAGTRVTLTVPPEPALGSLPDVGEAGQRSEPLPVNGMVSGGPDRMGMSGVRRDQLT